VREGAVQMENSEWPLRWFNLFGLPVGIAMAVLSDSFWRYLGITSGIGFIIGGVLGTLFVGKMRAHVAASANPLARLHAEIRGAADTSLHIRFIFMQGVTGALIIAVWFTIAAGVVHLFR